MTTSEPKPRAARIGAALFLFAHQDDEIGVFPHIERAAASGVPVWCVYLTDGGYGGQSVERRIGESRRVLRRLGVEPERMLFLGADLNIPDGALVEHLSRAHDRLCVAIDSVGVIDEIYLHAWEGGHQDHDAVHLLGFAAARRLGLLDRTQQFPLYSASSIPFLPYALFAPLPENGVPTASALAPCDRWRYLRLTARYRSQAKTLLTLFPMLIAHDLTDGRRWTQPVAPLRLLERPHAGPLLYERRRRYSFDMFCRHARDFFAEFVA